MIPSNDDIRCGYDQIAGLGRDKISRVESQMLLIRFMLGLNPAHDPVQAIDVLYKQGREAFEKLRGPRCEYANQWRARTDGSGQLPYRKSDDA